MESFHPNFLVLLVVLVWAAPAKSSCTLCFTIGFTEDGDGDRLDTQGNSLAIDGERAYSGGMTVTDREGEVILVYDTNQPGPEPDLVVFANNALIVQNDGIDADTGDPEPFVVPDDDPDGGWIVFNFDCPVSVGFIDFADTEEFPFVDFFNVLGVKERVRGPKTGNNAVDRMSFGHEIEPGYPNAQIKRVEIKLKESGAISAFHFCHEPPTI